MQIRVIFCELRSPPRIQHSSRLAKQSRFIFIRPILMLLLLISQLHSIANRKKRSSSSSMRTGTSLHGNLLTCRVYPGDWLRTVCESTLKCNQSRNIFDGPPYRREKQLARNWLGFWQLSSSERFTTPSGSPMLSWSPRRTSHFACALTLNTSIGPARKIISLSPALTR